MTSTPDAVVSVAAVVMEKALTSDIWSSSSRLIRGLALAIGGGTGAENVEQN